MSNPFADSVASDEQMVACRFVLPVQCSRSGAQGLEWVLVLDPWKDIVCLVLTCALESPFVLSLVLQSSLPEVQTKFVLDYFGRTSMVGKKIDVPHSSGQTVLFYFIFVMGPCLSNSNA